eukprot:647510-Amorphochlora_amoeboformis.AAC.1
MLTPSFSLHTKPKHRVKNSNTLSRCPLPPQYPSLKEKRVFQEKHGRIKRKGGEGVVKHAPRRAAGDSSEILGDRLCRHYRFLTVYTRRYYWRFQEMSFTVLSDFQPVSSDTTGFDFVSDSQWSMSAYYPLKPGERDILRASK